MGFLSFLSLCLSLLFSLNPKSSYFSSIENRSYILLWLQFNDLQECYLQKRRQLANKPHNQQEKDKSIIPREGYNAGLADFQSVLSTFTQYRYVFNLQFLFELAILSCFIFIYE